jgi:uncharacterized protein (DUF2336 family)
MVPLGAAALASDLEQAVRLGTPERRVEMLRKMTDLFLSDADRLNENQIKVFDDVLVRLMERIEARTLAQLSDRMADISSAPREVVRQLAVNSEIEVAGPLLTKSTRLSKSRAPVDEISSISQVRRHVPSIAIMCTTAPTSSARISSPRPSVT